MSTYRYVGGQIRDHQSSVRESDDAALSVVVVVVISLSFYALFHAINLSGQKNPFQKFKHWPTV